MVESQDATPPSRLRVTWTPAMDNCFIELMVDETNKGNKVDQGFNKKAWVSMVIKFNQAMSLQFDKQKLKNRYKTIKNDYIAVKVLLDQDGFTWDAQRRMVTASDRVWEEYCKTQPDAARFRTKYIPYYDELCTIFANKTICGRFSCSAHDIAALQCQEPPTRSGGIKAFPNEASDTASEDVNMEISPQSRRRSATSPTRQRSEKVQRIDAEDIVKALNRMTDALYELVPKRPNLFQALEEVLDVEDDLILDAYELLEDQRKAKIFLELPVTYRKKWLLNKLRQQSS